MINIYLKSKIDPIYLSSFLSLVVKDWKIKDLFLKIEKEIELKMHLAATYAFENLKVALIWIVSFWRLILFSLFCASNLCREWKSVSLSLRVF